MRPGVGRRPVKTATWLLTLWAIVNGSSSWALAAHVALIHSAPTLGNVAGNLAALRNLVQQAFANGANVVVTPELSATGYSITRQQVRDGSGFQSPYPQLDSIRDTAIANAGYVFVAIAAVTASGGPVYNTVAVYGPDGLITTQEKRGLSGWHDRGVLPFDILRTPYGDIGYLICSDSYLPDWSIRSGRQQRTMSFTCWPATGRATEPSSRTWVAQSDARPTAMPRARLECST